MRDQPYEDLLDEFPGRSGQKNYEVLYPNAALKTSHMALDTCRYRKPNQPCSACFMRGKITY